MPTGRIYAVITRMTTVNLKVRRRRATSSVSTATRNCWFTARNDSNTGMNMRPAGDWAAMQRSFGTCNVETPQSSMDRGVCFISITTEWFCYASPLAAGILFLLYRRFLFRWLLFRGSFPFGRHYLTRFSTRCFQPKCPTCDHEVALARRS